MKQETVIKKETQNFIQEQNPKENAFDYFEKLKVKSQDFDSLEDKMIFWSHVKLITTNKLKEHRDNYHNGQPAPNCKGDIRFNKILEFIEGEM